MKPLLIAVALAASLASPVLSQPAPGTATQPAVPALNSGEEVDSGVGATDPQSFVGRVAMSADGREIGPIREAEMASDTSDGGVLVVEHGGRTLRLPAAGASVAGERVTVSSTFERATAN
ncbi:hypothetical protein [Aureimonas jatrophae]|nr:hypothetical protein [Aureimonas jatrophae]MBB3951598.1 hypothetical protein [Aureimonas jatrophae]